MYIFIYILICLDFVVVVASETFFRSYPAVDQTVEVSHLKTI